MTWVGRCRKGAGFS